MATSSNVVTSTGQSKRYRKQHRRFDCVPAPYELEVNEIYLAKNPNASIREVIDEIIRLAHKYVESRKKSVAGNS